MKYIALFTKKERDAGCIYAKKAAEILLDSGCGCVLCDSDREAFSGLAKTGKISFVPREKLFDGVFCAVIFGGDGTIMRISHETSVKGVPVLGVNLGRVGYLAEIEPDELGLLSRLAEDGLEIEKRMMLRSTQYRGDEKVLDGVDSLNDIVVSKGDSMSMAEIELKNGDSLIGSYVADGLIVATPTGSTAYSLAAGGSVVDTSLECMCVTPVAPQSFYAKPIIFGGTSRHEIRKGKRGHGALYVSCDGNNCSELKENDVLVIEKSPLYTEFIHVKKTNFCNILNNKMRDMR